MGKYVRELTLLGALAALYVALCFTAPSFGPLQFRIAEVLIVLPFYNKKYAAAVVPGTFIANFFGEIGIIDAVVGSAASALVCLVIILVKRRFIIAPAAALINGIIIGLMLYLVYPADFVLTTIMLSVGASVFIVALIGVIAFAAIEKTNPSFINMLKEMKISRNKI